MKKILWLLFLALFSLMNTLAQEFEFTHEGHTLKYVRNLNGVTCDYAQANISGTVKIPSTVYFELCYEDRRRCILQMPQTVWYISAQHYKKHRRQGFFAL